MKRVSPRSLVQSRPLAASLCLSIYARDRQAFFDGYEEAKLTALKDYSPAEVALTIRTIGEWIETKSFEKAKYPLAVFAARGFSGMTNLPDIPKNLAVVATSFHVKPLLKWLQREKPFFVVSFEIDGVRIYQGSLLHLRAIDHIEYEPKLTFEEFLSVVHRATNGLIEDEGATTILAGPPSVTDRFYLLGRSKSVAPKAINDLVDLESTTSLHRAAIEILEPHMRKMEDALVKRYWRSHRRGEICDSLRDLIVLGLQGRIRHLYVSEKMNLWGQIDYRTGRFTYSQRQLDAFDDCILDDLSEIVIFHGGRVTVLPTERMPNNHAACAIVSASSKKTLLARYQVDTVEAVPSSPQAS